MKKVFEFDGIQLETVRWTYDKIFENLSEFEIKGWGGKALQYEDLNKICGNPFLVMKVTISVEEEDKE